MSSGALTERAESAGGITVRPQSVGMTQASQRVIAEAQAALTVAAARPRDQVDAIDRIKTSCQRLGVASVAEYCFSRGGQEISGPSIKLLEVVAGAWGNIQSGFRELSRSNGESVVEAFAWDLETNHKKVMEFTVRHWRDTRSGGHALKDERDIYELIANMAQRRVRKCLESVIPRDVVDEALDECAATLKAKCVLDAPRIKSMADKFSSEYGVTVEQIEKRIQRRIDSITQAQFISLGKIYTSLKDGMSKAADWFDMGQPSEEEKPANATEALKSKLKKTTKVVDEPQDSSPGGDGELTPFQAAQADIEGATSPIACKSAYDKWKTEFTDGDAVDLAAIYEDKLKTFPTEKPKKSGQLPLQG